MTADALVNALGLLDAGMASVETFQDSSADLEAVHQADAIALVQDLKKRLAQVELSLAITLGKAEGQHQGYLPDGRMFTLKRTAERKAWDHEDWKRDARRAVVSSTMEELALPKVLQVVDQEGEVSALAVAPILHEAIAMAQEVHGSTAPRSTALKRLGLYASDYCESSPGGWKFDAIAPHDTTTKEN